MTDIDQFRRLAQPPPWALKTIGGGRLRGMTDIKPAWRIQAMTEVYGLCGTGWRYEVMRQWTEPGSDGQVFAFVNVALYVRGPDGEWSAPIPGTGGNMLLEMESKGLHANDEAFKMATTDALSSAMRMIGMAADVYAGQWTGSKYNVPEERPLNPTEQTIVDQAALRLSQIGNMDELETYATELREQKLSPKLKKEVYKHYQTREKELQRAAQTD